MAIGLSMLGLFIFTSSAFAQFPPVCEVVGCVSVTCSVSDGYCGIAFDSDGTVTIKCGDNGSVTIVNCTTPL